MVHVYIIVIVFDVLQKQIKKNYEEKFKIVPLHSFPSTYKHTHTHTHTHTQTHIH